MAMYRSVAFAILALASIARAHADELQPLEGRSLVLGDVSGVVYYTIENNDLRVVATFAAPDSGPVMRFQTVLAPGQSIMVLVPSAVDVSPYSVEFIRQGDHLLVQQAAVTN